MKLQWEPSQSLDPGRKLRIDVAQRAFSREILKFPGWMLEQNCQNTGAEVNDNSLTIYTPAKRGSEETRPQTSHNSLLPTAVPDAANASASWCLRRVITGHKGWVQCLAGSQPGASSPWLASGGADTNLNLWNTATGKLHASLTGHKGPIRALATDPIEHHRLFSAGEDRSVKLWDLSSQAVTRSFHGHAGGVYALALMPELEALATAGRDKTVRLWDLRTPEPIRILRGHTDTVTCLASRLTEPLLISGGQDRTIRFWDIVSGREVIAMAAHHKSIRAISSSNDQLWSAGVDGIRRWRLPEGDFLADARWKGPSSIVQSMTLSDSRQLAAVGSDDGSLRVFDFNSGAQIAQMQSRPMPGSDTSETAIMATLFEPGSEVRLFTGDMDKTIKVWERTDVEHGAMGSDNAMLQPLAITL